MPGNDLYCDGEGWVSLKGNMFYGNHTDVAFRFFGHRDDPHRAMDEAGWWKLQFRNLPVAKWSGSLPATEQQKQYIKRWVRDRNDTVQHGPRAEVPAFRGYLAEQKRSTLYQET